MNNQRIKPRLKWVDTAKGICILLVILYHTTEHIMDMSPAIRDMLRATRMPLYYTIAGLFVSIKSPQLFLNKKINRLIIPFCFFILLGNLVGYIKSVIDKTDFTYFSHCITLSQVMLPANSSILPFGSCSHYLTYISYLCLLRKYQPIAANTRQR